MSVLDNLPQVINIKPSLEDVKSSNENKVKPFIIVYGDKIPSKDIELLKNFGRCLEFHESYINIPLANHKFDYCVVDIREKSHRQMLMKENLENYHIVVICSWFQEDDDFIKDVMAENILHHLPEKLPFKSDFDKLLLSKKIRKPSCSKIVLRVLKKVLSGWSEQQ